MAIVIGTDEAGYGPNFGPLVISATRWLLPDRHLDEDLYRILGEAVCRAPDAGLVPIADSKLLYKPGKGLGLLERGVLSCAEIAGHSIRNWREAWRSLAPTSIDDLERLPWYQTFERRLPMDAELQAVQESRDRLVTCFDRVGVTLQEMRSVALFPHRFNQLVESLGTKGGALSEQTLSLAEQLIVDCDERKILVQCDKHGGRNRYAALLQHRFPDYLVEIVRESRAISVYRWGPSHRRVEFRFVAKGENFLPAALASMISKFLRELAMQAFNAFWQHHLPDIRPTAGYPVDASRFRKQIQSVQSRLGIADQVLWRNR